MKKLDKTFKINPLYESDGYKVGHHKMLAPGTTKLYGTWIPRNLKYMPGGIDKIMSAGQQMVVRHLHSTFAENFFCNREKALEFAKDMSAYLGMDYNGEHFEDLWDLGYLPIRIKALPEGMFTEPNVPHMTFVNTVDGFAWLTLFLETYISKMAWQMPTAATIAHKFRQNANEWVEKTDRENMWVTQFMCHDFHARGGNPFTSIAVGLGHALSNQGSDTLNVIPASRYYYDEPEDNVVINSVNASEHSVSTTKIFTVGEQQMIADWIKLFPTGMLSVVGDTFSIWEFIEYCRELKEKILARDGKIICRPDSGNPVDIICGNAHRVQGFTEGVLKKVGEGGVVYHYVDKKYYRVFSDHNGEVYGDVVLDSDIAPEQKGVIELLWDIFGGTVNEQGYKVLDPHIGAIYGDSLNLERQVDIYSRLEAKGFAASNVVLGVGSFTYVMLTRDSAGYAAKGSWFEVEEEFWSSPESLEVGVRTVSYNIYKDPITDDGTKISRKGLLQVTQDDEGGCVVKEQCTWEEEHEGMLRIIYEDGDFHNQETLTEIRERLNN